MQTAELAKAQAAGLKRVSSDSLQESCDEIEKNVQATESLVETASGIAIPLDSATQETDLALKAGITAAASAEAAEKLTREALAEARAASAKVVAAHAAASEEGELLHVIRYIPQ